MIDNYVQTVIVVQDFNFLNARTKVAAPCSHISFFFFADDRLFLFCKVSSQECWHLIDILRLYEAASGQKINTDKSWIFSSANTPEENKIETLDILGTMQDSRHNKYLGLPSKSRIDVMQTHSWFPGLKLTWA